MVKFIAYIIGYALWMIAWLFPRNNRIWIFGGVRGEFNDNAKYLFLYCSQKNPSVCCVWISYKSSTVRHIRNLGLKSYSLFSCKGLYYALRGGYYFFNAYSSDICYFTSGKTVCVNLWHGVGLKKIEFCIDRGPLYNRYVRKTFKERFYYPQVFRRPDWFVSSTPFQTIKFAKAFRISEKRCLNMGYPRNDILLMGKKEREDFIGRYESEEIRVWINKFRSYDKIYLYMPTWRESQRNLFSEHMDLYALNIVMREKNSLLVLKPHPNTLISNPADLLNYSNICLLQGGVDMYPLLPYTHVLITDYSSILYDYLLMEGKQVILYLYDYADYVKERDFNYPFLENVTGELAYSFDDLLRIIKLDVYDISRYTVIRERFWGDYVGNACRDVAGFFI